MSTAGAGTRRLLVALVAGLVLLGALIALQLVDDNADRPSTTGDIRVKGASVSRASLDGTMADSAGWPVEITVTVGGETRTTTVGGDGRDRVRNLLTGLAEVAWVAERADRPGASPEGIALGGARTGRTHVTLGPGANTLDLTL